MTVGRRTARRKAVFILYQRDLLKLTLENAIRRYEENKPDEYTFALLKGATCHETEIDKALSSHISGWSIDRLGVLERSILRVAAYEMLWESDVPSVVAIDEAVVLAKRFCSDEAGALVNGILGSMLSENSPCLNLGPSKEERSNKEKNPSHE